MAWSPYKEMVVGFVADNPGCSKMDVARRVTRDPRRNPYKQYHIVNTALRNGWIIAMPFTGKAYALYTPEAFEAVMKKMAQEKEDRAAVAADYIAEHGEAPSWA